MESLLEDLSTARKQIAVLRQKAVAADFQQRLDTRIVHASENITASEDVAVDIQVLATELEGAEAANTLRQMVDRFRQNTQPTGVVVLASVSEGRPVVIAGVTEDLVQRACTRVSWSRHLPPTSKAAAAGDDPGPSRRQGPLPLGGSPGLRHPCGYRQPA